MEVNARLSRSSALASKAGELMTADSQQWKGTVYKAVGVEATGYPLAYVAAKIALGGKAQLG